MKKIKFLLIILLALSMNFKNLAQESRFNYNINPEKAKNWRNVNGVVSYRNKPFSGDIIWEHEGTKNISSVYPYKNGKINGESKEYYEDGNLKRITNWVNSKINGDSREYYQDGVIKEIRRWVNGNMIGSYLEFDSNGILVNEGVNLIGFVGKNYFEYYPNKILKLKISGVSNFDGAGLWEEYYINGDLKVKKIVYQDGSEKILSKPCIGYNCDKIDLHKKLRNFLVGSFDAEYPLINRNDGYWYSNVIEMGENLKVIKKYKQRIIVDCNCNIIELPKDGRTN